MLFITILLTLVYTSSVIGQITTFDRSKKTQKHFFGRQINQNKNLKLNLKCEACALLAATLLPRLKKEDPNSSKTVKLMENFCKVFKIQSKAVCYGAIENMKFEVMHMIKHNNLDAEQFCGLIPGMNCFYDKYAFNRIKWTIEVPPQLEFSTPSILSRSEYQSFYKNQKVVNKKLKILHLSDAHIDLHYKPDSPAFCKEPLCCRDNSPGYYYNRNGLRDFPNKNHLLAANHFLKNLTYENAKDRRSFLTSNNDRKLKSSDQVSNYWISPHAPHCDIPLHFVRAAFDHIAKNFPDLDMIYWTGDLPPHNVWESGSDRHHLDLMKILGGLFMEFFPNVIVQYAIGNHENVPVNSFPLDSEATAELYETMAEAMQPNAKLNEKEFKRFSKHGFYSNLVFPKQKFRVISLNTNLCNNQNYWLLDEEYLVDPDHSLMFLTNELIKSEKNSEKVHILGHIAPGCTPDCVTQWSAAYNKILNRFRHVVSGQFFGHYHVDEFQLVWPFEENKSKGDSSHPIDILWLGPSLTTYDGGRPAFRILETDRTTKLSETSTYLVENYTNPKTAPTWKLEYRLTDYIGGGVHSNEEVAKKMYQQILLAYNDETEYKKFYLRMHKGYLKNGTWCVSKKCRKKFLCDYLNGQSFLECPLK